MFGSTQQDGLLGYRPGSLVTHGLTVGVLLIYFTNDWVGRDVLEYVPWYNKRYEGKPSREYK